MITSLMAGAFLRRGDKVLMMKRSMAKKLNPGKWAPIGGKLEPGELNDPRLACLREIAEETGIEANLISGFTLKRILVRHNHGDGLIYINYLFAGKLAQMPELRECGEGTLHWVDFDSLPDYEMSFSIIEAVKRLVSNPDDRRVLLGAVGPENDEVVWNEL